MPPPSPPIETSCDEVLRSVVFPGLRLVVWMVIAAALVVIAFRGSGGDTATSAATSAPEVDLESPVVPVAVGTVQNVVTVSGTVVADASVPVKSTAAGKVRKVLVAPGRWSRPGTVCCRSR